MYVVYPLFTAEFSSWNMHILGHFAYFSVAHSVTSRHIRYTRNVLNIEFESFAENSRVSLAVQQAITRTECKRRMGSVCDLLGTKKSVCSVCVWNATNAIAKSKWLCVRLFGTTQLYYVLLASNTIWIIHNNPKCARIVLKSKHCALL